MKIHWNCGDDFKLLGIIFDVDLHSMKKKHHDNALDKKNCMLKIWLKHNLTVLGHTTVVKSLIHPLCNYYVRTLPLPEKYVMLEINSLLFGFVLRNKSDHVSPMQLVKDYSKGDLKMVNFMSYFSGLKISCFACILGSKRDGFSKCLLNHNGLTISNQFIMATISPTLL